MGVAKKRVLAMLIAVVMVMTSAAAVFAATESPDTGAQSTGKSTVHVNDGTITVDTGSEFQYRINKGKTKTAAAGTTIKVKKGDLVVIKTAEKTSYRWVQTTKITKAKNKKVTWKKVKGASKYMVRIVKKNGKVIWKTTKKTSYNKVPKGAKVSVRPVKKSGSKNYFGSLSGVKTVK